MRVRVLFPALSVLLLNAADLLAGAVRVEKPLRFSVGRRMLVWAWVVQVSALWLERNKAKTCFCVRPHLVESTTSRPICEVKQPQAQLVLRSVMTWEP